MFPPKQQSTYTYKMLNMAFVGATGKWHIMLLILKHIACVCLFDDFNE